MIKHKRTLPRLEYLNISQSWCWFCDLKHLNLGLTCLNNTACSEDNQKRYMIHCYGTRSYFLLPQIMGSNVLRNALTAVISHWHKFTFIVTAVVSFAKRINICSWNWIVNNMHISLGNCQLSCPCWCQVRSEVSNVWSIHLEQASLHENNWLKLCTLDCHQIQ